MYNIYIYMVQAMFKLGLKFQLFKRYQEETPPRNHGQKSGISHKNICGRFVRPSNGGVRSRRGALD